MRTDEDRGAIAGPPVISGDLSCFTHFEPLIPGAALFAGIVDNRRRLDPGGAAFARGSSGRLSR